MGCSGGRGSRFYDSAVEECAGFIDVEDVMAY